jgi:hypothetical protein
MARSIEDQLRKLRILARDELEGYCEIGLAVWPPVRRGFVFFRTPTAIRSRQPGLTNLTTIERLATEHRPHCV